MEAAQLAAQVTDQQTRLTKLEEERAKLAAQVAELSEKLRKAEAALAERQVSSRQGAVITLPKTSPLQHLSDPEPPAHLWLRQLARSKIVWVAEGLKVNAWGDTWEKFSWMMLLEIYAEQEWPVDYWQPYVRSLLQRFGKAGLRRFGLDEETVSRTAWNDDEIYYPFRDDRPLEAAAQRIAQSFADDYDQSGRDYYAALFKWVFEKPMEQFLPSGASSSKE